VLISNYISLHRCIKVQPVIVNGMHLFEYYLSVACSRIMPFLNVCFVCIHVLLVTMCMVMPPLTDTVGSVKEGHLSW